MDVSAEGEACGEGLVTLWVIAFLWSFHLEFGLILNRYYIIIIIIDYRLSESKLSDL